MTRRLGADQVAEAARLLRAGELVAFPTETVYGLGADARNGRAVAAVFEAKGRPHFNPLICHFPDAEAAFAEVIADDRARALTAAFWPGPLTLVLPRRTDCRIDLLAGAQSARPRQNMCWKAYQAASPLCWMAGLAMSVWKARCLMWPWAVPLCSAPVACRWKRLKR